MNKSACDETSCPLTLNAKGHFPGVVAIVRMPHMLICYDCGRLDHDETPYPFWEKVIFFIYIYLFYYLFIIVLGFIEGGSYTP